MSQLPERDDDLDIERLRKQVSEIRTIALPEDGSEAFKPEPVELNDFAKRVWNEWILQGIRRLIDDAVACYESHPFPNPECAYAGAEQRLLAAVIR